MPVISSVGRTRVGLCVVTALSATIFAWAALVLPSEPGTALGLLAAVLAAAHAGTLLAAWFWPARLREIWRAVALLSLGAGAVFVSALGWTSLVLISRFGSLGVGVSALLGAIVILLLLATFPFGIWGLFATRGVRDPL